jgi:hypothetical protein
MAVEAYVNLPTPSTPLLGQPTLSGGIDDTVTSLIVSSNANVPAAAPFRFIIGDEILYCSARPSTTWTVARGQEGSTAAAHLDGVTVVVAGVLTAASLKNNPLALTTTGDLPYLNSSGNQARLGIGSAGAVLTVTAGVPAWTLTPSVTSLTLAGALSGVTTLGMSGAITTSAYSSAHDIHATTFTIGFTAANKGYFTFQTGNIPTMGTDENQTRLFIVAHVDTSASKYGNSLIQGYLRNHAAGGSEFAYLGDIGWEGVLSDAGVLDATLTHMYIWDGPNNRTMFDFNFLANSFSRVLDAGFAVHSVSNKATLGATAVAFTGTPGATTWASLVLKPTINLTSGTSTTLNVLDIDTVNTVVTGLTTNLINVAYGGTQRLTLTSTGQCDVITESGAYVGMTNYAASVTGGVFRGRKFRGTVAAPRRAKASDGLLNLQGWGAEAVDDSTAATIVGASGAPSTIKFLASEDYTATAHGSNIQFLTTTITTLTVVTRLTIDDSGLTLADAHNLITGTGTGMKIGTATTQKIGFFNATPVVQPTDGATLTNSVTSGGTTDTIANYTDLTIYANDAAAIRNDIYQLSRKLKIVVDNMRLLGLES